MWKKVMYLAAGIIAVVALIAGIVSTTSADDAAAQKTGPFNGKVCHGGPAGPGNGQIMTRVAEILGIDKQKLEDAFKQAFTELAPAKTADFQSRLDDLFAKWVADGKLTQAQADQYKDWLKSKPDGVPGFGMGPGNGSVMNKLLENGKITQEQYDLWKAWMDKKPNIELPKPEKPADRPAGPCFNKAPAAK